MARKYYLFNALALMFLLSACTDKQVKVEPKGGEHEHNHNSGVFDSNSANDQDQGSFMNAWHRVVVEELLETTKYSYLRVKENEDSYWIATLKQPYRVGEVYLFKSGLLKTNFKSVEHNRIFERLYLVSEIQAENSHVNSTPSTPLDETFTFEKPNIEGLVEIGEIVKNPSKYNGKMVKVYGKVVKVNPNIMNRNWLHLQDGTADNFDFVLTTTAQIPEGHAMAFEGRIALDRDFGSGYAYSIIMEDANLIR